MRHYIVKMTWFHPKMPFPQRVRLLFGSLSPSKFGSEISSFADLGCLSRIRMFPIPDLGSWIQVFSILDHWSQIWIISIPDPGSRMHIKDFKYFNQKNGFSALRNMIWVFHPRSGSRIWILTIYLSRIPILDPRSRIQGSKRHLISDPGSRIRICNTGDFGLAQAVGGSVGYWLSAGAAVLRTHSIDQLSEAFMCKENLRIFYLNIISLIFTIFKLWCPAHLFPNTPRMLVFFFSQ